jgi:tetratricopeptide (TPR) repeat protein
LADMGANGGDCRASALGQGFTATRPSLTSRALVNLAQADGSTGARVERIEERLKDAAEFDPVDPEPWRMRAQLALREWKRTHDEKWFERAIESQREVIARDPKHAHDYRALAEMYLDRFEVDHRPQEAETAVEVARQALVLYPNHLASRKTLAIALDSAGKKEEAVQAARAAVELDALWLELAHYDKVLTADERAQMKAMAGDGM